MEHGESATIKFGIEDYLHSFSFPIIVSDCRVAVKCLRRWDMLPWHIPGGECVELGANVVVVGVILGGKE